MSNWNKVNSEMYSLTDGPYHCIVRESGQMYYCEVFRNDDLILVSTVEGLQEAKNTCEIEILADLQKRGLFNVMLTKEMFEESEVEETVIAQIRNRRDVGREKYGTTMEREDLSFIQWLQHLQEELLDAAIYAEKLKREHRKELLSDMIADDENSGLYD